MTMGIFFFEALYWWNVTVEYASRIAGALGRQHSNTRFCRDAVLWFYRRWVINIPWQHGSGKSFDVSLEAYVPFEKALERLHFPGVRSAAASSAVAHTCQCDMSITISSSPPTNSPTTITFAAILTHLYTDSEANQQWYPHPPSSPLFYCVCA